MARNKWSKQFEYPNNNFTRDLTIICSESHKEIIYKHNQLDENKVYVTGLPRNDKFFNTNKSELKQIYLLIYLILTKIYSLCPNTQGRFSFLFSI